MHAHIYGFSIMDFVVCIDLYAYAYYIKFKLILSLSVAAAFVASLAVPWSSVPHAIRIPVTEYFLMCVLMQHVKKQQRK